MSKKVTIGGQRLGSGNKMTTTLRSYERSTHDLGYLWRSTLAPGTLVPFLVEPALPGDTWDIGLAAETITLPTVGPLFGSFKLQLDVFSVPIRLYQAQLHNNKLYIGLSMDKIKLPQMEVAGKNLDYTDSKPVYLQQIHPSSLLSYLGVRGIGQGSGNAASSVKRFFDATPLLAYWDIYKNYYANKMEEIGVAIHTNINPKPYSFCQDQNCVNVNPDTGILSNSLEYTSAGQPLYKIHCEFTPDFGTEVELKLNGTWRASNLFSGGGIVIEPNLIRWEASSAYNGQTVTEIRITNPTLRDDDINLETFPLSNLDDMREDILSAIKTQTAFTLTKNTYAPYGFSLGQNSNNKSYSVHNQQGLGIKTYQSDIFNNWLNTEWIDSNTGINAITSVDVSEGKFTIDTLNLAKKVYMLLNDIAVSGGSYDDWIEAAWDIDTIRKAESPLYEGGLSREIIFEEVVSQAASEQTLDSNIEPLGTLGGRGVMSSKNKGGKCVIKVNEPSYIIGIVSITPRIDYSQGNRWYTNLKSMNDFHKPALDQIGFQDLITDQMLFSSTDVDNNGNPTFKTAGKQPAWINYQTNFNRVYGGFADEDKEMFMTLNRRYEPKRSGIADLTTYIDPSKFNYAFASTNLDAQNFWTHIAVDATVRRKMSAKIMPNP